MKITTIGIDLAKCMFQVHDVDERGKTVLRKQLKRSQVAEFIAQLPALPGRHGSLWQRALLGAKAAQLWAYGQADVAAVCEALCEEQQERRLHVRLLIVVRLPRHSWQ